MKAAKKAEDKSSAPVADSSGLLTDTPLAEAAAEAQNESSEDPPPSSVDPEETAEDLADDAEVAANSQKNIEEEMKSLIDFIDKEAASLIIDKAKDVMKKVQGDGFTDAYFSLLALKMFIDKVLARIYLGYKNLTKILTLWRRVVMSLLKEDPKKCTGDFIIKQIDEAMTKTNQEESEETETEDLTSDIEDVIEEVKDISAKVMEIYQDVAELIANVSKIVQDFIKALANCVAQLLKQLIQLFESMLNLGAVGSGANINLPNTTPLFTILLGLVTDEQKKEDKDNEEEEEKKKKNVINWQKF